LFSLHTCVTSILATIVSQNASPGSIARQSMAQQSIAYVHVVEQMIHDTWGNACVCVCVCVDTDMDMEIDVKYWGGCVHRSKKIRGRGVESLGKGDGHTRTHTRTHIQDSHHVSTCTRTGQLTRTHARTRTHTRTHTHTCTHTHTHTHTYTHTSTHTVTPQ
jgi:hypothetical protein